MKFSASDIESGIAVVSCTFIYGALVATPSLSSLMFVASMSKFNIDREHASLPFLLCYTIKNAFGSIFGLKKIILFGSFLSSAAIGACFFAEDMVTITILWGVAFGFSFGLGVSFLPQVLSMHFSKHLDKSIGIIVGGECIVSFFLTLLTDYSLKSYGLSGTFLILSCVVLHSVPAAMLIRRPKNVEKSERLIEKLTEKVEPDTYEERLPCNLRVELQLSQNEYDGQITSPVTVKESEKSLDKKSSLSVFKVFLDPTYILILVTQGAMLYIYTMINIILIDVSIDHGVSTTEAVYILASFQVADAIGRFTLGFVTDYGCLSKANFLAACFAAIGLLLIAFIWIKGFVGMMAFIIAVGFFKGGLLMISPSIVMHYIAKDYHSMAVASRCFLYTPVSFTQAPLIGHFRDTLQSYDGLICILVGICCASSIISILIPPFVRFRERKKDLQHRQESGG
ncbi:Monocarboxylate transporter 12 like protein [Argiope bruennichi]|uniref:Monocarboxylate transporter 12 like protein n=1 Tax=Argiope bruennichi TaxID=94029 RepID=A0A8T0EF37_ARGBR|nr:Monocarboxylate transporter 12 like protein [Argiope bruennichi]